MERPRLRRIGDRMSKWIAILLAAFVALAILGFLVDAARWLAGAALVVLLVVIVAQFLLKRARKD